MSNTVIWSPGKTLDEVEREIIFRALSHYRSKVAAAIALGRTVRTIDNKLEQYEKQDEDSKVAEEAKGLSRQEWLEKARGVYKKPGNPPQQVPVNEETKITNLRRGRAPKTKSIH